MPNTHVRKFIDKFKKLADICIINVERRASWIKVVTLYSNVMRIARQKDDFTDAEIDLFQDEVDHMYAKWIDLLGERGVTNYFHMLGSGHFRYYLMEWRNLNRYSQQGWESLNSQIKQVYFRRTQRGGHGGKAGERNSKVKPIARWIQRKLYWMSGKSDHIANS